MTPGCGWVFGARAFIYLLESMGERSSHLAPAFSRKCPPTTRTNTTNRKCAARRSALLRFARQRVSVLCSVSKLSRRSINTPAQTVRSNMQLQHRITLQPASKRNNRMAARSSAASHRNARVFRIRACPELNTNVGARGCVGHLGRLWRRESSSRSSYRAGDGAARARAPMLRAVPCCHCKAWLLGGDTVATLTVERERHG